MRLFKPEEIATWNPCHDPSHKLPNDWPAEGATAVDFLRWPGVAYEDRVWLVLRPEIMSEDLMRQFALWGARRATWLLEDPAFTTLVNIAEDYHSGAAPKGAMMEARKRALEAKTKLTDPDLLNLAKAALAPSWESAAGAAWAVAVIAGPAIGEQEFLNKLMEMLVVLDDNGR